VKKIPLRAASEAIRFLAYRHRKATRKGCGTWKNFRVSIIGWRFWWVTGSSERLRAVTPSSANKILRTMLLDVHFANLWHFNLK
jgi:hypothetical protein